MNYEGIFILNADKSSDSHKKSVQFITDVIQKQGGSVKETQEWGRKRLGHPIRHTRDGFYVMMGCELKSDTLQKLHQQLQLNDEIMKFMITKKIKPRAVKVRRRRPNAQATAPSQEKGE